MNFRCNREADPSAAAIANAAPKVIPQRVAWLIFAGFFLFLGSSSLFAGEPTDLLRVAAEKGIQILHDPSLKSKKEERIARLREIAYSLFDFTEMARRSLGPHWRRLTPEEQREFTSAFRDFLEKTYADKIDSYRSERAVFTREVMDRDFVEVYSKLINDKGDEFSVAYKLHRKEENWKIYDVVFENLSVVNNYRSQFQRILAKSSFAELMQMIRKKAD